jgi:Na+-transporting NADH:ubiquinone oxidoreductase subunit NqrF
MFQTFTQIILSLALSLGLAMGFSPNAQAQLKQALNKIEATVTQTVDLAEQSGNDLTAKLLNQVVINASAIGGANAFSDAQAGSDTDLETALSIQAESQAQAGVNGSVNANAQTSGTVQTAAESSSLWSSLFNGFAGGSFDFSLGGK